MKRLLLALLLPALLVSNVFAETYYIDDLVIKTSSDNSNCASGSQHSILVTGSIGPDSTFAVGKLIDQRKPCRDASGSVISPIEVTLESGGGHLEDGYKLGDVFRAKGVTTIIPDSKMCASSCAVAFLGGKKRIVADTGSILFHAPYLKQMQLGGKERITCDLPKEELRLLNDYYNSMTSVEVGDRLYERTMWYCSAKNGWTLKGRSAAELYGIATIDPIFKSIPLLTESAEAGVLKSQYNLGLAYIEGKGIPVNKSEGISWLIKAGSLGYSEAQYALGYMFYIGEGVPKSIIQAYLWMSVAKMQGHTKAARNLRTIESYMPKKQIAQAQALAAKCYESDYKDCD